MNYQEVLINDIERIDTTDLGISRIKRNLELDNDVDVVDYCKNIILDKNSTFTSKGKNYYITRDCEQLTVNKSSFTIITAHIIKK